VGRRRGVRPLLLNAIFEGADARRDGCRPIASGRFPARGGRHHGTGSPEEVESDPTYRADHHAQPPIRRRPGADAISPAATRQIAGRSIISAIR